MSLRFRKGPLMALATSRERTHQDQSGALIICALLVFYPG